jgi:hypothetical protein
MFLRNVFLALERQVKLILETSNLKIATVFFVKLTKLPKFQLSNWHRQSGCLYTKFIFNMVLLKNPQQFIGFGVALVKIIEF